MKKGFLFNCFLMLVSVLMSLEVITDVSHNYRFVEGGSFQIGSNSETDEKPIHKVTVSSFYISKYEVTQKEWQEVMGNNPSHFRGSDLPVESVTWYEVIEFCNKKSLKDGLTPCYSNISNKGDGVTCDWSANGYRLPTEAEWEYAALGGEKSKGYLYSGSNTLDQVAWYNGNSGSTTHTVGSKAANELGLYDMSGNVWEWCWDNFSSYSDSAQTDPYGAESGSYHVIRGGSWSHYDTNCRVADRFNYVPEVSSYIIGLRLCRTLK